MEQGASNPKLTHSIAGMAIDIDTIERYNGHRSQTPEDESLGCLAKILVQAYLEQKNYATTKHSTK